tara:strand:+ start:6788 stop:7336 length:549 start_codon:yes stop_codon:yes gene_type:complete
MHIKKIFILLNSYYHYLILCITVTLFAMPILSLASSEIKTIAIQSTKEKQQTQQNIVIRKLDAEKVKRGKIIYRANCANCHGKNGESKPGWRKRGADGKYPPPPLNGSAHTWHHSTTTLYKTIKEGSPPEIGNMPAWGNKLTDNEINDVIVWITSIWPEDLYAIWYKEVERRNQKTKEHKLD